MKNKGKVISLVLGLLMGLGAYLTDGDVSLAVKTAFDKDAQKAACIKLIDNEDTAVVE